MLFISEFPALEFFLVCSSEQTEISHAQELACHDKKFMTTKKTFHLYHRFSLRFFRSFINTSELPMSSKISREMLLFLWRAQRGELVNTVQGHHNKTEKPSWLPAMCCITHVIISETTDYLNQTGEQLSLPSEWNTLQISYGAINLLSNISQ